MKKKYYEEIKETLYHEILDNGLNVFLLPKKEYVKTFASFSTKYGSFDNEFEVDGVMKKVPDGIAHFLEHKMFDMPDNTDAFQKMTELGTSCNAFTSYDKTTYLFSATSNLYEATSYLIEFVQSPQFSKKSIDKELGIIDEEIKMYLDYPDEQIRKRLLKNMISDHPILVDIAGSCESIKEITAEDLYRSYYTFYQPSNMIFFACGNFDVDKMIETIKNSQKKNITYPIIRKELKDHKDKVIAFDEGEFDIVTPKVYYGIKLPLQENISSRAKFEFVISIMLDLLLGTSTDFYNQLLSEKLINANFDIDFLNLDGLTIICCDAETKDPDLLQERFKDFWYNISDLKLKESDFIRIKNSIIASYIKTFNSMEAIANTFTRYYFKDMDFFDSLSVLEKIELNDIYEVINTIKKENISFFKALPKK